jgi:prepilin-type N-terminal cleavage/methylation domain-containing protein
MNKGVTLVELLAAMVVSALVVALASRIYLSGHHELVRRITESEDLDRLYRLKAHLRKELAGEISKCDAGGIKLRADKKEIDLFMVLHVKFPTLDTLRVACLVADTLQAKMVPWAGTGQPQIVEYEAHLAQARGMDWLRGSVLRR